MGKLVLQLPDGSTREFKLERERVTIGRRPDNDICLPFPAVSGEHAAVVTILEDSFLEDLHSTNGTLVNGKAITKHFLRDHDEIDIGRHTLVYVSGDFELAAQRPLPEPMGTVAVTANGGATIGGDEATLVPPPREPRPAASAAEPAVDANTAPDIRFPADIAAQPIARLAIDEVARNDSPADAPTLEVLDGPGAGQAVAVGREDFVLGRPGATIAVIRRDAHGFRLQRLEGVDSPRVNGTPLPDEGVVLAAGDEIEIAGRRLLYRPAL